MSFKPDTCLLSEVEEFIKYLYIAVKQIQLYLGWNIVNKRSGKKKPKKQNQKQNQKQS